MKIIDANKLVLRPAMDVIVSVDETPDKPTGATAVNCMSDYEANARVIETGAVVTLMDLCNGGFYNNGQAQPITTEELPDRSKYGFITDDVCGPNGVFTNIPAVTITADYTWDCVTIMMCDSKGEYSQMTVLDPIWAGTTTTVPIETFTPNERMHIAKVALGKAWQFDNNDLVNMTVNLRGVNCDIEDGTAELEGSEIQFTAYVGADGDRWIDIFSRMQKYAAITFTCGYTEDMSDIRSFYLTEVEYDSQNKDYPGKYVAGTRANVRQNYYNTIKAMITDCGIIPEESGTVPTGTGTTASNLFFKNLSRRELIASACSLYTDPDEFAITYRDGGIPELIAGAVDTEWEIDEEDVADFVTEIEMNVNEFETDLFTYSVSTKDEELAVQTDAIAGESYIIEANDPFNSITNVTSTNNGAGTATKITPYVLKLVCTKSGDLVVNGRKIIEKTTAADNPRVITDPDQRGISVNLGERMKVVSNDDVTLDALRDMLDVSNLKYSFKWRGNPHMKTSDIIRMKRVSTGNMYPANNIYPNETLHPKGGAEIRMRITAISLEVSDGGGLVSDIEARRCS